MKIPIFIHIFIFFMNENWTKRAFSSDFSSFSSEENENWLFHGMKNQYSWIGFSLFFGAEGDTCHDTCPLIKRWMKMRIFMRFRMKIGQKGGFLPHFHHFHNFHGGLIRVPTRVTGLRTFWMGRHFSTWVSVKKRIGFLAVLGVGPLLFRRFWRGLVFHGKSK